MEVKLSYPSLDDIMTTERNNEPFNGPTKKPTDGYVGVHREVTLVLLLTYLKRSILQVLRKVRK